MMKLCAVLLIQSLVAVPAVAGTVDAVHTIRTSRDGKKIALLEDHQDGTVMRVVRCSSASPAITITDSDLQRFLEDARIDSVDWSADSRWLKIEVTDGDVSRLLILMDSEGRGSESLHEVKLSADSFAAFGSWALTGATLYVVPDADHDQGIYVVNPAAGRVERLMTGYTVSGDLSVADQAIITKVHEVRGDLITDILVSVNLRTGAVTKLMTASE